jgi:hypothetical protein
MMPDVTKPRVARLLRTISLGKVQKEAGRYDDQPGV